MSDDIWQRREPQSPCIKICSIHPAERICIGCYRTPQEISFWERMSAEERQAVLDALPARAPRIRRRRGGRRARQPG